MMLLIPLILIVCYLSDHHDAQEHDQDQCNRFSPEDLRAVVFWPELRRRLDFLSETFTAAIEGLETLHKKSKVLPDELKGQMGVKISDKDEGSADLKNLLDDLIRHVVRADVKAWNRIIDTNHDILDKSRAPKSPRSLSDLKTEIEGLKKSFIVSEESFEPLMKELGSSIGKLLSPMMMIIEGMMSAGGGEMSMDNLRGLVDNLMGRVLLKMITNKQNKNNEKTNEEKDESDEPALFRDLLGLAENLAKDFYTLGRKMELTAFWKRELTRFGSEGVHHTDNEEIIDENVDLITAIVE